MRIVHAVDVGLPAVAEEAVVEDVHALVVVLPRVGASEVPNRSPRGPPTTVPPVGSPAPKERAIFTSPPHLGELRAVYTIPVEVTAAPYWNVSAGFGRTVSRAVEICLRTTLQVVLPQRVQTG